MSFNQRELRKVDRLCEELQGLIRIVQDEIEEEAKRWEEWDREHSKNLPKTNHIRTAQPSKATGELRRRSMDLTRALADLRRY